MYINKLLRNMLDSIKLEDVTLPPRLASYVERGFLQINNIVFYQDNKIEPNTLLQEADASDGIYSSWLNTHLHIDDDGSETPEYLVQCGITFIKKMIHAYKELYPDDDIACYFSLSFPDGDGSALSLVIHFHKLIVNQPHYLEFSQHRENSINALLILESHELHFFEWIMNKRIS